MYNSKFIIPGLALFLIFATSPFWYNVARGSASGAPKFDPHSKATACILPAAEMRSTHMKLLNDWRNQVVRQGQRIYKTSDNRAFQKSLTNTCLQCHESKAEFCDKCHAYSGVEPNCWTCHVDPTEASHK